MSASQILVEAYTDKHAQYWDEFVHSHSDGTFFHRAGWKNVIESVFSHRTHFLLAKKNENIVGVLPLVEIRSRLFGSTLSSVPFCVSGGLLVDSDDAAEVLFLYAKALAKKLEVGSLELRGGHLPSEITAVKEIYVNFSRRVSKNHDTNLSAVPRKQRAMIRKGIAANLKSEETEDSERFFPIYAESVRNLGTPVFSRRLFQALKSEFDQDCRMLMITHAGVDVAAVMSFYHGERVMPYYGGGTAAARVLKANDFMYWELMCRSVDDGYFVFDYGRSKVGTGSFSFKKNWGFEPKPLQYYYFLVNDKRIPEVNPLNPKYRFLINTWRRLPLPIANVVGPWISSSLG